MANAEEARMAGTGAEPLGFPLDRRRDARVGFVTPTLVGEQRRWEDARSANVSARGMLLRTSRPLARGSVLDVYFELPNGRSIRTSGVVVASRGDRASLHFSAIGARDRALLRRFVVERRGLRTLRGRTIGSRRRWGSEQTTSER